MKIYKKLADCKKQIREHKLKKEGKNTFSNYSYFTPAQVDILVLQVCEDNGLFTKFDLVRNEYGITGVLSIIDVETSEIVDFKMATDIPEIKATNIAQQLGGCMTYTERYLKQTAFGIIDNSLDFDTTENTEKAQKEAVIWLTEDQFNKAIESNKSGIEATLKAFSGNGKAMKKEYRTQLENKLKTL
jgi:hypothetical protein